MFPLHWEHGVLTTGPSGKSLKFFLLRERVWLSLLFFKACKNAQKQLEQKLQVSLSLGKAVSFIFTCDLWNFDSLKLGVFNLYIFLLLKISNMQTNAKKYIISSSCSHHWALIIIIPWSVMFNLYIHNQSLLPSDYFEVNNRYLIILSVYILICIFK